MLRTARSTWWLWNILEHSIYNLNCAYSYIFSVCLFVTLLIIQVYSWSCCLSLSHPKYSANNTYVPPTYQHTVRELWTSYWVTLSSRLAKKVEVSIPHNICTLHHICCGIMRHLLRNHSRPEIDNAFSNFRMILDSEMKCLQAKDHFSKWHRATYRRGRGVLVE